MQFALSVCVVTAAILLRDVTALATSLNTRDYCKLCNDHTMCIYPEVGKHCLAMTQESVNKKNQRQIVELHNNLRSRVALGLETLGSPGPQPGASNMREMVWDPELARIAQRFVDQCLQWPENDACRRVKEYDAGQNVYRDYSMEPTADTDRNWRYGINKWFGTVAGFPAGNVAPFIPTSISRAYTQLVWAETGTVGCGHAYYKVTEPDYWYHDVYICNYGPAGNVLGQAMYDVGEACSKCPKGTRCSSEYPGLCKTRK